MHLAFVYSHASVKTNHPTHFVFECTCRGSAHPRYLPRLPFTPYGFFIPLAFSLSKATQRAVTSSAQHHGIPR